MITAALNGELDNVEFKAHEVFGVQMPTECPNVPNELLSPKQTWADKSAYDAKADELAKKFVANFEQFSDYANEEIMGAAPKVSANA